MSEAPNLTPAVAFAEVPGRALIVKYSRAL
jgi:hypothetical protein